MRPPLPQSFFGWFFIFRFPGVTTDSFIYGDIAKNWLQHGVYGLSSGVEVLPTYIRLPGYPAFLAAIFAIFGMDHYRAALIVQMFVDLGSCFLIADLARRVSKTQPRPRFFWLPFALSWPITPRLHLLNRWKFSLPHLLLISPWLALSLRIPGPLGDGWDADSPQPRLCCCGRMAASCWWPLNFFSRGKHFTCGARKRLLSMFLHAALVVGLCLDRTSNSLDFAQQHTMHRFQPLAPRYANEENEFVPMGFNRWVKTWIIDYASVEEVYWRVPGDRVDPGKLPDRAFDSPLQREADVASHAEITIRHST